MDILINLLVGLVASVLTLVGDRYLARQKTERRIKHIAGRYRILPASNSSGRSTAGETISIEHLVERRFAIKSIGCRVGDWAGSFVMSDTHPECGRGVYSHVDYKGWGTHEFQIETDTGRIRVYGVNQDRAGAIAPFSYVLERISDGGQMEHGRQQPPAGDVLKAASEE